MNYSIGETISTQNGRATCTLLANGMATFKYEDGSVIALPIASSIPQEKINPPKGKRGRPKGSSNTPKEISLSDFDEQIANKETELANAKAQLAKLHATIA